MPADLPTLQRSPMPRQRLISTASYGDRGLTHYTTRPHPVSVEWLSENYRLDAHCGNADGRAARAFAVKPRAFAPVAKIHARRTTFDSPSAGFLGSLVTVQFVCRREATIRRSTLATALVAVFISYLATPAAVKTGGYVRKDRVVNKTPLINQVSPSPTGHAHHP